MGTVSPQDLGLWDPSIHGLFLAKKSGIGYLQVLGWSSKLGRGWTCWFFGGFGWSVGVNANGGSFWMIINLVVCKALWDKWLGAASRLCECLWILASFAIWMLWFKGSLGPRLEPMDWMDLWLDGGKLLATMSRPSPFPLTLPKHPSFEPSFKYLTSTWRTRILHTSYGPTSTEVLGGFAKSILGLPWQFCGERTSKRVEMDDSIISNTSHDQHSIADIDQYMACCKEWWPRISRLTVWLCVFVGFGGWKVCFFEVCWCLFERFGLAGLLIEVVNFWLGWSPSQ